MYRARLREALRLARQYGAVQRRSEKTSGAARLAILVALAAAIAAPASAEASRRARAAPVAVRVDTSKPGPTIPKSFLGFSIEYPDLPSYAGTPRAPNDLFVRLIQ